MEPEVSMSYPLSNGARLVMYRWWNPQNLDYQYGVEVSDLGIDWFDDYYTAVIKFDEIISLNAEGLIDRLYQEED